MHEEWLRLRPLIRTGLPSMDAICKGAQYGSLIIIFGPTASGKTAIIKRIASKAMEDLETTYQCSCHPNVSYRTDPFSWHKLSNETVRNCYEHQSKIKLIELEGASLGPDQIGNLRDYQTRRFGWSVMTIQSQRKMYSKSEVELSIERPSLFRQADFVFRLEKLDLVHRATCIKNRYRAPGDSFFFTTEYSMLGRCVVAREVDYES